MRTGMTTEPYVHFLHLTCTYCLNFYHLPMRKILGLTLALLLLSKEMSTLPHVLNNQDMEFIDYLLQAYFCTGDPNWWKLIGKTEEGKKKLSGARFIMHTAVGILCPSYHLTKENKAHLINDAKIMVTDDKAGFNKTNRNEIKECFGKALNQRLLVPYFCPNYDGVREWVDTLIQETRNLICSDRALNKTSNFRYFVCYFLNVIPAKRQATEEILEKFGVCPKRLQKRLYDLKTFLKATNGGCSGLPNAIDRKMMNGETLSDLLFIDFYCCFDLDYILD